MTNGVPIQSKWTAFTRYVLAFVFFLISLFVRFKIAPVEAGIPFVTFYPAMVITFYLCGVGAGVFFAILSAITAYYLFTPPYWSFIPCEESLITVSTYSLSATIIGLIINKMQRNIVLLRQSEQRYQGFLEDQIEIICRFKADNTVIYVNEAFCRLCGKSREELLGHKWNPVVHPDDIQMVIDKVNSVSPSNPIVHIENRIIASDGSVIWGQFVNRGIFNEHGELLEMQAVGRDITERKLIEQALQSESHLFA